MPESIAGKTFTFGSKGSASGRLMPEYFLREQFEKPPEKILAALVDFSDPKLLEAFQRGGPPPGGGLRRTPG